MSQHKFFSTYLAILYALALSFPFQVFSNYKKDAGISFLPPNITVSVSITRSSICLGESTQIIITPSEIGVNYQLLAEGNSIGDAKNGNGASLYFTISPIHSTSYQVNATNNNTSESTLLNETISLSVIRPPNVDIEVSITENEICIGENTIISLENSESNVSYQLYDGSRFQGDPIDGNNSSISFPEFSPFRSVYYQVIATNKICNSSSTLSQRTKVLVGLPPEDNLHPTIDKHTICKNEEVVVSLTPTDPSVSYQLFAEDVAIGPAIYGNSEKISFEASTPLTSTSYRIEALGDKCLSPIEIRYTVDVDVHTPPSTNKEILANNDLICKGETVSLSVKESEEGMYYQLYDGLEFIEPEIIGNGETIDFPELTISNTTEFKVYTHETICSEQLPLNNQKEIHIIDIMPFSLESMVNPSEICLGEMVDFEIPNTAIGIEYILLDGNTEINSITGSGGSIVFEDLLPTEESNYRIAIGNCIENLIASEPTMEVHSKPSLQVVSRDVYTGNDGQLSILVSNGLSPYTFAIEPGGSYTTDENLLEINNLTAGSYRVLVVDANFCRSSDAGEAFEIKFANQQRVIVNNALTPNGDGINDEWLVLYENELDAPEVFIFNIYGQQIFHSKSYQNNWKGSFNGTILPNGTYYYSINFNTQDFKPIRGTLSILGNY